MNKLEAAFELFDAYNKQDPRTFVWNDVGYSQEYFFAIKLYDWVLQLDPKANEELRLAARSQHIGRWEIPRESYPDGREPYLKWRKDLALHHAAIASTLMMQAGYAEQQIERVKQIVLKQRIKVDPDVQTMENALCLVFLEFQYEEFLKKHEQDPEMLVNILRRSLLKMDSHGHSFALKLTYSDVGLHLIKEAIKQINKV